MQCILCGGEANETVSTTDRHGKPLTTKLCLSCGLVFNDPIPSDEELSDFYANDYRVSYKGAARPRPRQILRNFAHTVRYLEAYADVFADRSGRLLDVGAGSGEFLYLAGKLGFDAVGIEPNRAYHAYCRDDLGLSVESKEIDPASFEPGSFARIRLNHVLEHLNNPVRSLTTLANWLTDDGVLTIDVPDILIYTRCKSKGNMFHYGHIFNYSHHTLRAAAGLAGLVECEETREGCQSTAGFFRKGADWNAEEVRSGENARTVQEAIAAHYAGIKRTKPRSAPLRKFMMRVKETLAAKRLGGPRAIADHFAAKLT